MIPFHGDQAGGPPASILDSSGERPGGEDVCGSRRLSGAFGHPGISWHGSLLEAGGVAASSSLLQRVSPSLQGRGGERSDAWPPSGNKIDNLRRYCERTRAVFVSRRGRQIGWCPHRGQRVRGGVWRVRQFPQVRRARSADWKHLI